MFLCRGKGLPLPEHYALYELDINGCEMGYSLSGKGKPLPLQWHKGSKMNNNHQAISNPKEKLKNNITSYINNKEVE